MTKLKQSNIFDFYAPTGGGSKIADFGSGYKNAAITTTAAPSSNGNIGSSLSTDSIPYSSNIGIFGTVDASPSNGPGNAPKNDNTWVYWVLGAAVLGGSIYLIHRHFKNKEQEEKRRGQN